VVLIGAGGGFFSVGTLTAAMALDSGGLHGMVLGAWGGVVATAAGLSIALGGTLRDVVASLAAEGTLGEVMQSAGAPYGVVYHLELMLLLATLAAIGPLVSARRPAGPPSPPNARFGLAEFPN
jgi:BCD family chlorophyll transporter-like MFS transporter